MVKGSFYTYEQMTTNFHLFFPKYSKLSLEHRKALGKGYSMNLTERSTQ